jgi:hypothetical protein
MLSIIIQIILLPIILIKWDDRGLDEVMEGLKEICGID